MKKTETPRKTLAAGIARVLKRPHYLQQTRQLAVVAAMYFAVNQQRHAFLEAHRSHAGPG
jgi:hypothetical protein